MRPSTIQKNSTLPLDLPESWSPEKRKEWTEAWSPAHMAVSHEATRRLRGWTGPELAFLLTPPLPGTSPSDLFAAKRGQAPSNHHQEAWATQFNKQKTLDLLQAQEAQTKGDHWRSDLVKQLRTRVDPEHPWRVGHFDAIVEREGKLHLLAYRLPPGPQGTGGWASETDEQARVQAHHDTLLAAVHGINFVGWQVVSFDLESWSVQSRPLEWDEELATRLTSTGDTHWSLLETDQPSPHPHVSMPWEEVPSDTDWTHLATQFLAYSLLRQGAESLRDQINGDLDEAVSTDRFAPDLEHMAMGPAKLRVVRSYHEEKVIETARELMRAAGQTDEAITQVLNNPNLWHPAVYDAESLMDLVEMHLAVNLRQDPRFAKAITTPARANIKTLLPLIREMDPHHTVDETTLIDPERSSVRLEMPSGTVPAPLAKVRTQMMEKIGARLAALAREVAHDYPDQVKHALLDAPVAQPGRRRRTP